MKVAGIKTDGTLNPLPEKPDEGSREYTCPGCGHRGIVFLTEIVSGLPICSKCGALSKGTSISSLEEG